MPFEEIDKKIVEAASNHHPAYDEKAWDKMEALLNKHMPEEKGKRRAALWLLLLLVTAGGAGYFVFTKSGSNKHSIANKNSTVITTNQPDQPATSATNELSPNENSVREKDLVNPSLTQPGQKNQNKFLSLPVNRPNGKNKIRSPLKAPENFTKENPTATITQSPGFNPDPSINKSNDNSSVLPIAKDQQTKPSAAEKQATDLSLTTKQKDIEQSQTKDVKTTGKTKTRKGNGLFFSLTAGPDIATVELHTPGKLKLAAGFGVGYKFSDRISVQTGFYTARKIYTAMPEDYYPPASWWSYYPTLEKIDADCKVYEIPILLNYNFTRNKKANWFGTVGISSYLMKKEDYTYHYKTSSGQPATRNWVYNNENKHYFNVLTVAGGYERNLNKNLSVSFSPYFKTPLSGVGFGKVKLNSAGIMISANFKPFVKK